VNIVSSDEFEVSTSSPERRRDPLQRGFPVLPGEDVGAFFLGIYFAEPGNSAALCFRAGPLPQLGLPDKLMSARDNVSLRCGNPSTSLDGIEIVDQILLIVAAEAVEDVRGATRAREGDAGLVDRRRNVAVLWNGSAGPWRPPRQPATKRSEEELSSRVDPLHGFLSFILSL
jgi:hypothetical protein